MAERNGAQDGAQGRAQGARIMAHLVAGYPDAETCLQAARGLAEGGAACLELQFPFSDPTADGPLIQEACDAALRAGFRVAGGFALLRRIRAETGLPVFLMSYAGLVVAGGLEGFLAEAARAGATGLIVPDLPVDSDEGLYARGRAAGLAVVPVAVPDTPPRRLELMAATGAEYLYAALRRGITGERTELGPENLAFLERAAGLGLKVLAGFGVQRREQVAALAPRAHAVVVGSHFVAAIREASGGAPGSRPGGPAAVRRAAAAAVAGLRRGP